MLTDMPAPPSLTKYKKARGSPRQSGIRLRTFAVGAEAACGL